MIVGRYFSLSPSLSLSEESLGGGEGGEGGVTEVNGLLEESLRLRSHAVLVLQNVFSHYRMCSLTTECVLLLLEESLRLRSHAVLVLFQIVLPPASSGQSEKCFVAIPCVCVCVCVCPTHTHTHTSTSRPLAKQTHEKK